MLVPINVVKQELGVSRATVERLRRNPEANFPAAIRIGPNSIRFDFDEVKAWVESRKNKNIS